MPVLVAAGAAPTAAMATAVVPLAPAGMMEEDLYQMMAGALGTLRAAGCALVGGHSSEGAEMALGEWQRCLLKCQLVLDVRRTCLRNGATTIIDLLSCRVFGVWQRGPGGDPAKGRHAAGTGSHTDQGDRHW